jgi:hypothetical protein
MLAKLMKYEFKSTARLFIPLYAVLLVFALLNRFLNPFRTFEAAENFSLQVFVRGAGMAIYFFLILAVFVTTLVLIIQRFYKNLLGDEGYLMFTLPVKTWQHIANKLLTSIIWCILSALVVAVSLFVLTASSELIRLLPYIIEGIKNTFGIAGFFVLPALALSQLASGILMIYNAMALGQLFQKHRLLASFGMYCVLYLIQQMIYVICMLLLANTAFMTLIRSASLTPLGMNLFLGSLAIGGLIIAAAHFALVNYVLNTKLNLE